MKKILTTLAALLLFFPHASIAAMSYCDFLTIADQNSQYFDKMASQYDDFSGCVRNDSDSAHSLSWSCDFEIAENEIENIPIFLVRDAKEPSHVATILLSQSKNLNSLDGIRQCKKMSPYSNETFNPGFVFQIEKAKSELDNEFILASALPLGPTSLVVNHKTYDRSIHFIHLVYKSLYGVTPVSVSYYESHYGEKTVKIAGLSPVKNTVYNIKEALEKRDAKVTSFNDGNVHLRTWILSPPTGLPGVEEVKLKGWYRHLRSFEYKLSDIESYKQYISLLDGYYGTSTLEKNDDGCNYRYWELENFSIVGKYCKTEITITFYNDVVIDQLSDFSHRVNEILDRVNENSEEEKKQHIDRDML